MKGFAHERFNSRQAWGGDLGDRKQNGIAMNINALCEELHQRLAPMGGHVSVLDDHAIDISWNHTRGLIIVSSDGGPFLKVSTSWKDCETATTEVAKDIPDKMVELFQGFWERRDVKFKK